LGYCRIRKFDRVPLRIHVFQVRSGFQLGSIMGSKNWYPPHRLAADGRPKSHPADFKWCPRCNIAYSTSEPNGCPRCYRLDHPNNRVLAWQRRKLLKTLTL
jgi:hypothetical protein